MENRVIGDQCARVATLQSLITIAIYTLGYALINSAVVNSGPYIRWMWLPSEIEIETESCRFRYSCTLAHSYWERRISLLLEIGSNAVKLLRWKLITCRNYWLPFAKFYVVTGYVCNCRRFILESSCYITIWYSCIYVFVLRYSKVTMT